MTCETGLYNLTQDETTMLVHFKDRTEQYKLFRVDKQDSTDATATPSGDSASGQ